MDWVSGDRVGALLDFGKKTISFYRNGAALKDCVFKKVKAKKLFPVVQICHSNAPCVVNFKPKYPKGKPSNLIK
jgi:hypothetical protein